MKLILRRLQRSGGMLSNKVVFGLNARADLTSDEQSLVSKYRLGQYVVYDSEARKRHGDAANSHFDDATRSSTGRSLWKSARGLASAAMAALSLRITIDSLAQGQQIECKDLDELLGAEAAIREACNNLKAYLETALTFDGREEVIEF